jgi:hypothetical protein
MKDIRMMRRLTILCPLLTALLAVGMIGYQLHRRAAAQAKLDRLESQNQVLQERYQREFPNGQAAPQIHDSDDDEAHHH